jgi:hypothetical protein
MAVEQVASRRALDAAPPSSPRESRGVDRFAQATRNARPVARHAVRCAKLLRPRHGVDRRAAPHTTIPTLPPRTEYNGSHSTTPKVSAPMSHTTTELKHDIEKTLSLMRTLRDEIRTKVHLAGIETKDEWNTLQPELVELERTATHFTEATRDAVVDLWTRLTKLSASMS